MTVHPRKLKMKLILVITLCCLSSITAKTLQTKKIPHQGNRIIGGAEANAGEFPYAAAIYYNTESGRYFCGGALFKNQWIITASHCVYNAVTFSIRLGSVNLDDTDTVIVTTSEAIAHPSFDSQTFENDIGLIKLRLPVELTDYIQPVLLTTTPINEGLVIRALGWGSTSDENSSLSNTLNYVNVLALSNDECKKIYGDQIFDTMVCVEGNLNEGTCIGDLGGPLVLTLGRYAWHFGVASFISASGCESSYPSGFTRTYPYADWIKENTADDII